MGLKLEVRIKEALYNLRGDSGASIDYGKGVVLGVVATMLGFDVDFDRAVKLVQEFLPKDYRKECIPEPWQEAFDLLLNTEVEPRHSPWANYSDDEVALDETDTEALAEYFWEAIGSDGDPLDKSLSTIISQYESVDSEGKKIINMVLVALCGWQLPTMRKQSQL